MNLELGYFKPLMNDSQTFFKVCVRFRNLKKNRCISLPKRFRTFISTSVLTPPVTKELSENSVHVLLHLTPFVAPGNDEITDASNSDKLSINSPGNFLFSGKHAFDTKDSKAEKAIKNLSSSCKILSDPSLGGAPENCIKNPLSDNDSLWLRQNTGKIPTRFLSQIKSIKVLKIPRVTRFRSTVKGTVKLSETISLFGFYGRPSHDPFLDVLGLGTKIF